MSLQRFAASDDRPAVFAAPFASADRCQPPHGQSRRTQVVTSCQASEEQQHVNRRGLLGAGLSLAAASQLQTAGPADALVVTKEWEKVNALLRGKGQTYAFGKTCC